MRIELASLESGKGVFAHRYAPDELVRQLGRRDVEHAFDDAVGNERFHGHAAGPRRVEDEHFVIPLFQNAPCRTHARRRDPEHRRRDQRLVFTDP